MRQSYLHVTFLVVGLLTLTQKNHSNVGHLVGGYPQFDGWPKFTTTVHQQMHVDWIRRAFDGGLRLLVAHAVNNELLASQYNGKVPYDDVNAVETQIAAMKTLVANHADWMQIAYSSAEARSIIQQNKLAIVLGVEVDSIGGWKSAGSLTQSQIVAYLDHLFIAENPGHAPRLEGFRATLAASGIDLPAESIEYGDSTMQSGYEATQKLLSLSTPPTALFATNDLMALGAMEAALDEGLTLPGDLSVIGLDDIMIGAHMHPPLTTVATPKQELGRQAVELLLRHIDDAEYPSTSLMVRPHLIVRQTTVSQQKASEERLTLF